jgi:predicted aspartyl protease
MQSRLVTTTVASVCLLSCLGATAALAADDASCGPLKQIASIPLTQTKANVFTLPVTINGTEQKMLLDTGGMFSALTPSASQALKLERHYAGPIGMDVMGGVAAYTTHVTDLRIGGLKGTNITFMILSFNSKDFDGLMALAQLDQFDMDVDFGARTLKFMSPDHCKGHVIYWTSPTGIIPIRQTDDHAYVDVVLDGVKFHAEIDTGSTHTILFENQAAHHFDLTADSPDMRAGDSLKMTNKDGAVVKEMKRYSHTFKSLDFEGVSVRNPDIDIIHEVGGETYKDMILGMDVLSKLHLYFAFKEGTLYVSPGTPPPPDSPKPDAAPAKSADASAPPDTKADNSGTPR